MNPVIVLSATAFALAMPFSQLANADSLNLHIRNDNVGVGLRIGAPPVRYVQAPPAPPAYERPGHWGWNGYRQVWVVPAYAYPQQRWERPAAYQGDGWRRGWNDHRYYGNDRDRFEHDRHDHDRSEYHGDDRRHWR